MNPTYTRRRGSQPNSRQAHARIMQIIRTVATAAGDVPLRDFISEGKSLVLSDARVLAIATVAAEFPRLTRAEVGAIFHRSPDTIKYAEAKHRRLLARDPAYQALQTLVHQTL